MRKLYKLFHMPISRIVKKIFGYKEIYAIGIKKDEGLYKQILEDDNYWYADPILQEYNNQIYLFVEKYDIKNKKGRIAYSKCENGEFEKTIDIIEEPFHMSFPMTFMWNEKMYMIPETSADKSIRLYESESFPNTWYLKKRFEIGKEIVDSVILEMDEKSITVLGSEISKKNPLLVKFFKYKITSNLEIEFDDNFNNQQSFNFKDRNAGKIHNDLLPVQVSTNIDYGYSMEFRNKKMEVIETMKPDSVSFEGIKKENMIGIHSYAKLNDIEIIDLRYLSKTSN